MTSKQIVIALLLVTVIAFSAVGCGSGGDQLTKSSAPKPTDQLFQDGKVAYDKQDWLEAIRIFEAVRIQAPTSELATQATYMEAMARFNQDMFSGAAVDFRAVRRNYPNSPTAARAQYMIGESYYQLSPRPELDQSYSDLALHEFKAFIHDYPTAPATLFDSATNRVTEIRSKMAQKFYLAAQLYEKLEDPKSALVYYSRILDLYYDMPQAPEAELRTAEIQLDRKKLDDSRKAIEGFDAKYLQTATQSQRERALTLHSHLPNP